MKDDAPRRTEPRPNPDHPEAQKRRSWWPGWIWAIPVAAVGIVIWLAVRSFANSGVEVTVTFDTAAGMKPNDTKVTYRELGIGKLTGLELDKNGKHVIATLDIKDEEKKYLTTGTRFWLEGAAPSFSDLSSLKSIISGPSIIMSPGPGQPSRQFTGLDKPPTVLDAGVPKVSYRIQFTGSVGDLDLGAPVKLRGFTVGEVTGFSLHWDAKSNRLSTPVTIALYPSRIRFDGITPPTDGNWSPIVDGVLSDLIKQGFRARLSQKPPLIGDTVVSLEIQQNAKPADLVAGGQYKEIPAEGAGGIDALMAKAGNLPLDQIGDNIRKITEQVNGIVSSPEIKSSIDHLNDTLADLDKTVRHVGPQIGPMVASLRRTADELQSTADAADRMLGGKASETGNLKTAVHELTETARSIRSLANYLNEHPEAVLNGK